MRRRRPGPGQRRRLARRHAGRLGLGNPLRYRRLVDLCRAGSPSTRSTTARASPSSCREWSLPGPRPGAGPARAGPSRCSTRAERALHVAAAAGQAGRAGRASSRRSARRPTGRSTYVELYGAYAECEAVYGVDRLLALFDSPRRRRPARASPSTRGSSTGTTTSTTIHLPSVVEHARVRTTGGGRTGAAPRDRLRRAGALAPAATWPPSTSRTRSSRRTSWPRTAWLATRRLPRDDRLRFVAKTLAEAPALLALDRTRPRRLPAPLLPPLRGRARSTSSTRTPPSCSPT